MIGSTVSVGVGVQVAVGVKVGVSVAVAVGVGVRVLVAVGLRVAVGRRVAVAVRVGGLRVPVRVAVTLMGGVASSSLPAVEEPVTAGDGDGRPMPWATRVRAAAVAG